MATYEEEEIERLREKNRRLVKEIEKLYELLDTYVEFIQFPSKEMKK